MTGNELRQMRRDMGLTQEDMAKACRYESLRTYQRREQMNDEEIPEIEAGFIRVVYTYWMRKMEEMGQGKE